MTKLKYFDGIREAQKNQRPLSEMPPFDLGRIRKTGLLARIAEFIVEDHPRVWLAFLRRFRPTGKLFGVLLVTKNADVALFSPQQEHMEVMDHMLKQMAGT